MMAHENLTERSICRCVGCGLEVDGTHVCPTPPAAPSQLHMVVFHAIRRRVVEALARRRRGS